MDIERAIAMAKENPMGGELRLVAEIERLRAKLAAMESQEPHCYLTGTIAWFRLSDAEHRAKGSRIVTGQDCPVIPLYAKPVPADKPAVDWPQINELVTGFIDDYHYAGDGGYYCPTEWEKALITDCIVGLLDELPLKPAVAVPDGWKLVPVEPTTSQMEAQHNAFLMPGMLPASHYSSEEFSRITYRSMVEAAPSHSQQSASTDDLAQRLLGRAAFLRDRGEIKTPELLERAANAIR